MDFFAIASIGGFATPTPSAAARMSLIATWGYIEAAPALAVVAVGGGLQSLRMDMALR